MREIFRRWWEGQYVPYENDPNAAVFFVGGADERHWTANLARWAWGFYQREWKWTLNTLAFICNRPAHVVKRAPPSQISVSVPRSYLCYTRSLAVRWR